ncbi:hypothetical protein O6H91_02G152300 [Diphasiastrum complanatum]|uniref:Uncharacterized protein n=2 Tax=Diphasiastrum complanatum TaxID=34168 RepID=A0ACC2EMB8_DIPCM|nr:hypothetical protein O6H91_02G152300 [Diphasiastrum complanatum]KAJ7567551.1 hypothetical protein O6H91_02G152300 [Diphasiastrum complanatum]
MSTLAAARADNFYYPPEWTPQQGSLNKFHGQHALRERAKKIDQGILVIRFEMPFNIWCGGCNAMIAKGVRFNAEKKEIGKYFSTKIWSFRMKAACCRQEIEIHTDPKNCEYIIISGATQKIEAFDAIDAETIALPSAEDREKLIDPFYHLEHEEEDILKGKQAEPLLIRLQRDSDLKHGDSYARNKALRAQLRAQKKRVAAEESASRKLGLGIRLLPALEDDVKEAEKVKFASKFELNQRNARAAINASSIFSKAADSSKRSLSSSNSISKFSDSDHKLHLLAKKRKLHVAEVQNLVTGKFKLSSKSTIHRSKHALPRMSLKIKPA